MNKINYKFVRNSVLLSFCFLFLGLSHNCLAKSLEHKTNQLIKLKIDSQLYVFEKSTKINKNKNSKHTQTTKTTNHISFKTNRMINLGENLIVKSKKIKNFQFSAIAKLLNNGNYEVNTKIYFLLNDKIVQINPALIINKNNPHTIFSSSQANSYKYKLSISLNSELNH